MWHQHQVRDTIRFVKKIPCWIQNNILTLFQTWSQTIFWFYFQIHQWQQCDFTFWKICLQVVPLLQTKGRCFFFQYVLWDLINGCKAVGECEIKGTIVGKYKNNKKNNYVSISMCVISAGLADEIVRYCPLLSSYSGETRSTMGLVFPRTWYVHTWKYISVWLVCLAKNYFLNPTPVISTKVSDNK